MQNTEPRIVPWRSKKDLARVCELLYPAKFVTPDLRQEGVREVKCWASRGPYLAHTVESTAHLTEAKLLDEQGVAGETTLQLSYTMAMIRFVNGLLDPTQQSQFAIPLHVLAERMGLPSWFVELRHCGTHEREMPSLDMLRMAVDQALEWLWDNYWSVQPEQDSQGKEAQMESLETSTDGLSLDPRAVDRVMKKIPSIVKLLTQNPNLGKGQLVSSAFTGDHASQNPPTKKHKTKEKPEEKLESFVVLAKEAWRGCKADPDIFVEKYVQKSSSGSPVILDLLAYRIQSFGFELSRWLLKNYQSCLKSYKSLLREVFDGPQLKNFVSHVCEYALDVKNVISDWEKWSTELREYPNWISLQILQRCDVTLPSTSEKFRKRYRGEVKELKCLLEHYKNCVLKSEITMYQLASGAGSNDAARNTESGFRSQMSRSTSSILSDLQTLKQTARTHKIYAWEPVDDWIPRPFGQV
ncbi:LAME_0G04786g1_1 [Lachancea meyersii CBS 8951]|uniref:LAME_0G04786g1_1 n=1 Tax=Lachancea meyersii CBS 8951 TaxID=1266667 RepID=A0A1G4K6Y2_9SACH|nr:LAME_0G04786g1_1 [Lachancea meyersii CBS 8951]